jgi:predicted MFS family arabinose efflux permease
MIGLSKNSSGRPPSASGPPSVGRVLGIVRLAIFASSLFVRAVDPVTPQIANDFSVDIATAAMLSTAFALPYALVQPILGAMADMLGKTRLITFCLLILVIAALVGAFATSFAMLMASRIITGIVAGGVFPISLAMAGDLVPVHQRQVAISRLLAAAMLGNVLGSPGAGFVADLIGWRGIFAVAGGLAAIVLVAAIVGFRGVTSAEPVRFSLAAVPTHYRMIFGNPMAKVCFGAVFLEGVFLFGLFPYVAPLLHDAGEPRASIAGAIIAGFGAGGLIYSVTVSIMLARLGERRLMIAGGVLMGLTLMVFAIPASWPFKFAEFVLIGFAFYMLHGVIQIYATELAPSARGSSMALHSAFFFFGQAIGPVVYRFGLAHAGLTVSLGVAGLVIIGVGIVCSRYLRRRAVSGRGR